MRVRSTATRPPFGRALAAWLGLFGVFAGPAPVPAAVGSTEAPGASVFMYHRFGEGVHPLTNSSIDQLTAHIAELTGGGYAVMALPDILSRLGSGAGLPDRTIGLSIDDAFLSAYREAWPRFRDAGLPFTLFVATDPVDRGFGSYMSWDQIRELVADPLVTIGSQTASHPHMPFLDPEAIRGELARSSARFEAELKRRPRLFAYPYGEYSLAVRRAVVEAGFTAAFGQHSGVVHAGGNRFYLPRFAMNEAYGGMDRFRLAALALPLETADMTPSEPFLTGAANPPEFAFSLRGAALRSPNPVACYASHRGRVPTVRGEAGRIRVLLARPFDPGRVRINCTQQAERGRWRWFGLQFLIPG